jgi:hypothetical protein
VDNFIAMLKTCSRDTGVVVYPDPQASMGDSGQCAFNRQPNHGGLPRAIVFQNFSLNSLVPRFRSIPKPPPCLSIASLPLARWQSNERAREERASGSAAIIEINRNGLESKR